MTSNKIYQLPATTTDMEDEALLRLLDSPEQKRRRAARRRREYQQRVMQDWLRGALIAAVILTAVNLLAVLL